MDEPKVRKPRSDKGIPKGPRQQGGAPIDVRVVLRNGYKAEFGCASHTVENGFHVFVYPAENDRYRETRREFAISEVVDIEITAARPVYNFTEVKGSASVAYNPPVLDMVPNGRPKIHSVRRNLTQMGRGNDVVSRLETSSGPIEMSEKDLSGALGAGTDVKGIGDAGA